MAQLITSRDSCVRFIASRMSQHEDATSGTGFLQMSITSDDPRMSKKNLKVTAKCSIMASDESSKFQQL